MTQEIQYHVTWEIDIEASNAREAAEKAREIQRRYDSTATVFDVRLPDQGHYDAKRIDLGINPYTAARQLLIDACSKHMQNTLRTPETREKILQEGFIGFNHMSIVDVIAYVRSNELTKDNADLQWAHDLTTA